MLRQTDWGGGAAEGNSTTKERAGENERQREARSRRVRGVVITKRNAKTSWNQSDGA